MTPSEKVKFISNWIKDYANNMPSKAESLVIGISGGIDSSVSSTLSAMTGLKTIVLSMPIKQKSAQHDLSLAHHDVPNLNHVCLLYTSPSPRDATLSRMPSSA